MADANLPHMPLSRSVPRFWTWQEPIGRAANNPYIVKIVRPNVSGETSAKSGTAVADEVDTLISDRGLTDSRSICILLQNFGNNLVPGCVLGLHEDDKLDDGGGNTSVNSIYTANGQTECRGWMDDFIAQYAVNGTVPPARLHQDWEACPRVGGIGGGVAIIGTDWLPDPAPWVVQIDDNRAGDDEVNNGEILYNDKNLTTIHEDGKAEFNNFPGFNPSGNWFSSGNQQFSIWYEGIVRRVSERAIAYALYEPAKAAWPGVKCSNYDSSCRGTAVWPKMSTQRETFLRYWHDGEGDTQAPYCYVPFLYWADTSITSPLKDDPEWRGFDIVGSQQDAYFHHARSRLLAGFYGGPGIPLTPWFTVIGQSLEIDYRSLYDPPENTPRYECTTFDFYRLVNWGWTLGAREFLLWSDTNNSTNNPTTEDWNSVSNMVNRLVYEKSSRNRLRVRGR